MATLTLPQVNKSRACERRKRANSSNEFKVARGQLALNESVCRNLVEANFVTFRSLDLRIRV